MKPQDKLVKPVRPKTKVVKKPAKKRTTASSEPIADDDVGNPESEVELDSLGSYFVLLIDNAYYQGDAEGSHADVVEVNILSSASDPLPTSKIRRANRKVKFSHPLLTWTQTSFEDAATPGSPHNPAQRLGSYLRRFTEHCGSETSIRGLLYP